MNIPTAQELKRVDLIHAALDRNYASGTSGFTLAVGLDRILLFTAAEVRDWPNTKAELVRMLAQYEVAAGSVPGDIRGNSLGNEGSRYFRESVARGFCMYRASAAEHVQRHYIPSAFVGSTVREEPKTTERMWRVVGENENSIMWRRADTGRIHFTALDARAVPEEFPGYVPHGAHFGRRGYMLMGIPYGDYIPRASEPATPLPATPARVWDADKYSGGLSAVACQQQSSLDRRIAVAREELDREVVKPRFPHVGRNFPLEKWR